MEYFQHQPSERATLFISDYWNLRYSPEPGTPPDPVLPDGRIEMIFDLRDRFYSYFADTKPLEQPRTIIAGQISSSIMIGPSGDTDLFGVRFHPYGAYRFLRISMHELTDNIIDAAYILGNDEPLLFEMIASEETIGGRVEAFENYLLERIGNVPVRDLGAAVAAARIESSNGSMSVADLCRSTGWNARKLERLFLEQIGIGPKLFSRITRFQSFLRAVKTDPASPILDAVYDAGYYDQSHMTKDFRQFAGCSPTEYFRNDHEISTILANRD